MNPEKVKLELAKKEAEEKLRKEKEEAEEIERRRRNPEKSKTYSIRLPIIQYGLLWLIFLE